MLSFAYGSSIHDDNDNSDTFELLNKESMYIKIVNCTKEKALHKLIKYHRKCIQFGIDHNIIPDYELIKNKPIESLIEGNINTIFDIFPDKLEIMMISKFIYQNTYLKHYINIPGKHVLINLFMSF